MGKTKWKNSQLIHVNHQRILKLVILLWKEQVYFYLKLPACLSKQFLHWNSKLICGGLFTGKDKEEYRLSWRRMFIPVYAIGTAAGGWRKKEWAGTRTMSDSETQKVYSESKIIRTKVCQELRRVQLSIPSRLRQVGVGMESSKIEMHIVRMDMGRTSHHKNDASCSSSAG